MIAFLYHRSLIIASPRLADEKILALNFEA